MGQLCDRDFVVHVLVTFKQLLAEDSDQVNLQFWSVQIHVRALGLSIMFQVLEPWYNGSDIVHIFVLK